jgi:hypothetical protein
VFVELDFQENHKTRRRNIKTVFKIKPFVLLSVLEEFWMRKPKPAISPKQ